MGLIHYVGYTIDIIMSIKSCGFPILKSHFLLKRARDIKFPFLKKKTTFPVKEGTKSFYFGSTILSRETRSISYLLKHSMYLCSTYHGVYYHNVYYSMSQYVAECLLPISMFYVVGILLVVIYNG